MSLVLDFGDAGHRRTELDLPWYVNGTLDAADRDRVERHLAACSRCRSEERELRALQQSYVQTAESSTPADFESLRRRIEAGQRQSAPAEKAAGPAAPPWMRWAMAAQVFALAFLAAWVLRGEVRNESYRTLGAEQPAASTALVGEHRALLMFEPSLPQAQMRRLLHASGARIVDGPNPNGAYLVALPEAHSAQALQALRAAPGVLLAESVDPEPAP